MFAGLDCAQARAVVATTLDNMHLRYQYVPRERFGGDMLFFAATGAPPARARSATQAGTAAWAQYVTGRIEEFAVECEHVEMTQTEPLRVIGEVLARRLRPAAGSPFIGSC